jgi:translation initiation factor 1 (eIF-1/SUI1)
MSQQASEERQRAIVAAAETLTQATAELADAKVRIKAAREEYRKAVEGVTQAESADYDTLFNQDDPK